MKGWVWLPLSGLLLPALLEGCGDSDDANTTSAGGSGGSLSETAGRGGSRSQAGSGTKPSAGAAASDCLEARPQCFGQDSASCCQSDPGIAECVDGKWLCYGMPPPGCNGTLCADLHGCGPQLTCTPADPAGGAGAGGSTGAGGVAGAPT